jgi:hypothetical protein
LTREFAFNLTVFVGVLEFSFRFSFIRKLFHLSNFFNAVLSFDGNLISFLLEIFINLLNLCIKLFLLSSVVFKLGIFFGGFVNGVLEVLECLVIMHFFNQFTDILLEIFLIKFDKSTVSVDIGVILELTTKFSRGIFEILGHTCYFIFCFSKLSLVTQSLEFTSAFY